METALLIITTIALAAAGAAFFNLHRLKKAEQLRSEARVAALVAASDGRAIEPRTIEPRTFEPSTLNPAPRTVSEEAFFGTVQREAPSSPRFAFAAGLALIVALGGAAVVYSTSGHSKPASAPASVAKHTTPIELVSLVHERDASSLTISGIVRNPSEGPKLEGLTAVVSLIDDHGGLISTKDVPLDYRALGPGEEAPFKVTVPDPGSVARYRVSFRAGTDVVPHVDRRPDTKLASAL